MYDFYFGTDKEIDQDPKKFLLTVKRMMPRWCNSIPDSEFLAIYDTIAAFNLPKKPVFIETGSGASTLVLCYFAVKEGGELFTWDINGNKLSYLRSIFNDTIMRRFDDKNLSGHWKHIAYSSISPDAGIGILKEMNKKASVAFFDSEHTAEVLMKEVELASAVLDREAIVAIDDANYKYKYRNTAYVNMLRKKNSLPPVAEAKDNIGSSFWELVSKYLKENFESVEYLDDTYKKNYSKDLFWSYYASDRDTMSKLNMEKTDDLEHRFDSWLVRGKK